MGAATDKHMAMLRQRVELEMDSIGSDMVDGAAGVRANCNVMVEYTEGGGVIRSDRGDNPRREFGNLWASFGWRVTNALTIYSDMSVAHYARRLHNDLNRPFFTHLKATWDRQVGQRILQAIYGKR